MNIRAYTVDHDGAVHLTGEDIGLADWREMGSIAGPANEPIDSLSLGFGKVWHSEISNKDCRHDFLGRARQSMSL